MKPVSNVLNEWYENYKGVFVMNPTGASNYIL